MLPTVHALYFLALYLAVALALQGAGQRPVTLAPAPPSCLQCCTLGPQHDLPLSPHPL